MDATFLDAFREVLDVEGEFSDHPDDPGGKTRWGITEALARRAGYDGPMRELPKAKARRIYHDHFWQPLWLSTVARLADEELAHEMFESAVNVGRHEVALWLQQWLNVFNQEGDAYDDIDEDGRVGPVTLGALEAFMELREENGARVLRAALNSEQAVYYKKIAQSRSRFETFIYGWLLRRVVPAYT